MTEHEALKSASELVGASVRLNGRVVRIDQVVIRYSEVDWPLTYVSHLARPIGEFVELMDTNGGAE